MNNTARSVIAKSPKRSRGLNIDVFPSSVRASEAEKTNACRRAGERTVRASEQYYDNAPIASGFRYERCADENDSNHTEVDQSDQ